MHTHTVFIRQCWLDIRFTFFAILFWAGLVRALRYFAVNHPALPYDIYFDVSSLCYLIFFLLLTDADRPSLSRACKTLDRSRRRIDWNIAQIPRRSFHSLPHAALAVIYYEVGAVEWDGEFLHRNSCFPNNNFIFYYIYIITAFRDVYTPTLDLNLLRWLSWSEMTVGGGGGGG